MARLYDKPSPSPALSSRYASVTPAPDNSSDAENRDPSVRPGSKGGALFKDPDQASRASLPTPTSEPSNDASRGQKRKRVDAMPSASQYDDPDERRFNKYFDPNQDPEQRRDVVRKSRGLEREFNDNRDDILQGGLESLTETLVKAKELFKDVKQTGDATLDSRLLVSVSDLAYKKTAQLVLGDSSTGIDVDEFLSKCITFMRNGGPSNTHNDQDIRPTQRIRRNRHDDSDVEDDDAAEGELDWEVLGRRACYPHNVRPAVPSFLLGPLSVQKKQRAQTQRRARQAKDTSGREVRPEALTKEDLQHSEENGLTAVCTRIRKHLMTHCRKAEEVLKRAGFSSIEDLQNERGRSMLRKCRVSTTGGPSLFEYAINPRSFGQTVENLFYVSFLIKEGSLAIEPDDNGLPTLLPVQPSTLEEKRAKKVQKHQAVFAIDYAIWRDLVQAFEIRDSIIPHREEEQATQVGSRGWYA